MQPTKPAEDELLEQDDVVTLFVSSKWGPAVPYPAMVRPDGSGTNHGFIDFKKNFELIESVPEAQNWPGLTEVLRALNEQSAS